MLLKEILTLDLNNSIHAAKCLRVADKHKVIAAKWRSQARAEDRRMAKEENADPKRGLKRLAKQISTRSANSLRYVARDAKAAEGKKAGALRRAHTATSGHSGAHPARTVSQPALHTSQHGGRAHAHTAHTR